MKKKDCKSNKPTETLTSLTTNLKGKKDNEYSPLYFLSHSFLQLCQDVHAIQLDQSKARSGYDLYNPDTILHQQVTYIKYHTKNTNFD